MINFILLLVIYIGIYAILALGLNIVVGYGGMLSLCQAAFFAIGAYTTAILMSRGDVSFWVVLLLSGLLATVLGFVIGLPTLRLRGDYLAIATLGFAEITRNAILNWDNLTRGPMGITGIPRIEIFGLELNPIEKVSYVVLVWAFAGITYLILRRITRSRLGRALEAIREDEVAAFAMGINITKYKVFAFAIASFFGGIAGTFWAAYNQSVSPATFTFLLSVMILCMVVLGGMGNHYGAILGAVLITVAGEFPRLMGFSSVVPPQFKQIIFGLILVIMMVFRPQGILGRKKVDFGRLARRQAQRAGSDLAAPTGGTS
ncbi:MAG: branched-chain amino acid ABC transporter permease [Spirochaetota bacterium]